MNISDYKYKTELHAHTSPCSGCAEIPPESTVRLYSELGFSSIVISNHFFAGMRFYEDKEAAMKMYLRDYEIACEYGKKYGINVILGCEIRFTENSNDYLLFGIDEELLYSAFDRFDDGVEKFSEWFRADSRLLIQAHPFRNNMTAVSPALLDGIETFNVHPNHNSRIGFATRYAKEQGFLVTCGTDFHHNRHQGLCALLTRKPVTNSFELVQILRSRDYLFEMNGNIILPYGIR